MTKKRATTKKVEDTNENRRNAVKDLEIREPINLVRVAGPRMELHLRSGAVVKWPETPTERKKRLAAKPKPPLPATPDSEDLAAARKE